MCSERERREKQLRSPTYFCNPRGSALAPSFSATLAPLDPLHPIFGSLRSALGTDNKVKNIQNLTVGKLIRHLSLKCATIKIYSTNFDQCYH